MLLLCGATEKNIGTRRTKAQLVLRLDTRIDVEFVH